MIKKLKYLLFIPILLCLYSFGYAEYVGYYDFSGGLNDKVSNTEVADNEAIAIRNINLSKEVKTITKRSGYVVVSTNTVAGAYEIKGGIDYKQSDGDQYTITCSTNYITKLATDGSTWTTLCSTSSVGSTDYYDFTVFDNTLIINDGASIPKKYTGGDETADIGTGTDPDDWRPNYAQFGEVYKNRLWLGGKMEDANGGVADATTYNRVRFSGDYGAPHTFEGADAWPPLWVFDIDDVKIIGMKDFNGGLVVFGPNSINEIRGEMYAATNSFVLRKVYDGTGAASDRSIVVVDNLLYFISKSGHIYAYDGTGIYLISDKISTTINGLNKNVLYKSVGIYYPKYHQIWWSVANGTSTTNNLGLIYDTLQRNWSVYDNIEASALFLREVNGALQLYSGDAESGYIYRQDNGNIDYPDNSATNFNAYFTTKYFGGNFKEQDKQWDSIYINTLKSGDWDLSVTSLIDFGDSQILQTVDLDPGGALWDNAVWDVDIFSGDDTVKIEKINISSAGNFINFKFFNNKNGQPFTIKGIGLRYTPIELR